MSAMVDDSFAEWLQRGMDVRGWSQAELARRSGVTRGAINGVMTGARGPGAELCNAIAHAFGLPPETVFRAAGLLPPASAVTVDKQEVDYKYDQLTPEDRATVLALIDALIEKQRKETFNARTTSPVVSTFPSE